MHDLVKTLLESTNRYVGSRIQNLKHRIVYIDTLNQITLLMQEKIPLVEIKNEINELHYNLCNKYTNNIIFSEQKYCHLAFKHALDIIDSLSKRFGYDS